MRFHFGWTHRGPRSSLARLNFCIVYIGVVLQRVICVCSDSGQAPTSTNEGRGIESIDSILAGGHGDNKGSAGFTKDIPSSKSADFKCVCVCVCVCLPFSLTIRPGARTELLGDS